MASQTKAQNVADLMIGREQRDKNPDIRWGFRAEGSHTLIACVPFRRLDGVYYKEGQEFKIELTPGNLLAQLAEAAIAVADLEPEWDLSPRSAIRWA